MNTSIEMGFPKLRNVIISINYYTQNFPFAKLISGLRVGVHFILGVSFLQTGIISQNSAYIFTLFLANF